MLTFTSLGASTVRLKDGGKSLIFFPSGKVSDKEAILVYSKPDENPPKGTISWPGEYNEAGVSIRGIGHGEGDQVSFVVEADGVRSAFLSTPLQDWTDHQLEMVGDIDVLVFPSDDAKLAQKLLDEFDPRVLLVIPGKDHASIVKLVGPKETAEEYKVKGSLPAEGREVVVLSA